MSLQWYPGHMNKARRQLVEAMPLQDVVIELLDARMPAASENPDIGLLCKNRPCIKVLSKADLADPATTDAWLRYYASERAEKSAERPEGRVVAIATRSDRAAETRARIVELCKKLAFHPSGPGKTVRAIIVGIPNVGKSTLINTLMERKVAKVGDEPAVTKGQQKVELKSGIHLADNPGMMWPKIENETAALRLVLGGAIPDSAIDYESVALYGAEFFMTHHPNMLIARYKLKQLPSDPAALLQEIGRRRGGLRRGGEVDMHKAADVLIHDFRDGSLGRMSLEEPPGANEQRLSI